MALVWIPSLLRGLTAGKTQVWVEARTVAEALQALDNSYPGFRQRLCPEGELEAGMAVAVDDVVTPLQLLAPLQPESEVRFVPAITGG